MANCKVCDKKARTTEIEEIYKIYKLAYAEVAEADAIKKTFEVKNERRTSNKNIN